MLSYALLRPGKQICSLGKENLLWKELNLKPNEMNDKGLCYHGNLMNCNKEVRNYPGGCTWWHFYPEETKKDMIMMYKRILSGNVTSQNTNSGLFG